MHAGRHASEGLGEFVCDSASQSPIYHFFAECNAAKTKWRRASSSAVVHEIFLCNGTGYLMKCKNQFDAAASCIALLRACSHRL
jgi:hypothetical protein